MATLLIALTIAATAATVFAAVLAVAADEPFKAPVVGTALAATIVTVAGRTVAVSTADTAVVFGIVVAVVGAGVLLTGQVFSRHYGGQTA